MALRELYVFLLHYIEIRVVEDDIYGQRKG